MAALKTSLNSIFLRQSQAFVNSMSKRNASFFKATDLDVELTSHPKAKPDDITKCLFGKHFTDHMLTVEWNAKRGWSKPMIKPLQNFSLHPATSCFHYATALFEGMKGYRTVKNQISLFRPMENMKRMAKSAERAALPEFDTTEFLNCISELVRIDQEWVPYSTDGSLYLRPTFIGTEPSLGVNIPNNALLYCILSPVGPYFDTGTFNPVSLMADPSYIRAFPGGVGAYKLGCNYAPTIRIQQEALKRGCQQVLWLYGDDHKITEVGTMNLFVYWLNENGEKELATMPLTEGIVLPGVTRDSLLHLAREWNEFKVTERIMTMSDVIKALEENRLIEMFGAGTACVVCPVDKILYEERVLEIPTMENGPDLAKKFYDVLTAIQYGKIRSDWSHVVVENTEACQLHG